jgi:hypothetical protein
MDHLPCMEAVRGVYQRPCGARVDWNTAEPYLVALDGDVEILGLASGGYL